MAVPVEAATCGQGAVPTHPEGEIREGQGELATMADLRGETGRLESRIDSLTGRIGTLQWVVGVHLAISLATLAAVIVMALRPQAGARA